MPVVFFFRPEAHAADDADEARTITAALAKVTGVPVDKIQVFFRDSLAASVYLDVHMIDGPQVDAGTVTRALQTAVRGVRCTVRVYPPERTARGGRLRARTTPNTEEDARE